MTKTKTIHPLRATRSSPLSQGDKEDEDDDDDDDENEDEYEDENYPPPPRYALVTPVSGGQRRR